MGVTEDQTLQAIGDVLGVNRSTILRDFRELDLVDQEYERLMAEQPWVKSELTVAEFAQEIGATAETVRGMIRDGLITARRNKGRGSPWHIPVEELERFRANKT